MRLIFVVTLCLLSLSPWACKARSNATLSANDSETSIDELLRALEVASSRLAEVAQVAVVQEPAFEGLALKDDDKARVLSEVDALLSELKTYLGRTGLTQAQRDAGAAVADRLERLAKSASANEVDDWKYAEVAVTLRRVRVSLSSGGGPAKADASEIQVVVDVSVACTLIRGKVACHGVEDNPATTYRLEVPKLRNPTAIAINSYYACAIADDGPKCWASRGGNNPRHLVEGAPDVRGAKSFGISSNHACALKDGRLICWGSGAANAPRMVNVQAFSLNYDWGCAISGTKVRCWHPLDPSLNRDFQVDVGTPYEIAAFKDHGCAFGSKGIRCWGDPNHPGATPPALSAPRSIALNGAQSCTIDQGALRCWGFALDGEGARDPDPAEPQRVVAGGSRPTTCVIGTSEIVCSGPYIHQKIPL